MVDCDIESIDLATLAEDIAEVFGGVTPEGYLRGRTAVRDAVAAQLGCSDMTAENIVETMISSGFLRFDGDPTAAESEAHRWLIAV